MTTTSLFNLTPNYLVILFLMVVRIGALLMTSPVLGTRTVPSVSKIGIAVVLSFILLPTTAPNAVLPPTFAHLIVAIGKELVVGLLAGLAVTLLFGALQLAGTLVGIQIGFGFSSTVDLTHSGQSSVMEHLFVGLATLIFLTGNFHHHFLIGAQALFDAMPPNAFSIYRISPEGIITLSANMFLAAARIVLPLLGALLLTDVALGVMARTAPQMNVFFVGMPVKIAIGILAIVVLLPFFVSWVELLFGRLASDMTLILRYR